MERVKVALLAVIAAALIGLLVRPEAPAQASAPCVVVVNETPETRDGRVVYKPEPLVRTGC